MKVAKLESDEIFGGIVQLLEEADKETLDKAPVVGQVRGEVIYQCSLIADKWKHTGKYLISGVGMQSSKINLKVQSCC